MKQRVVFGVLLSLTVTIVIGSCIFQNDPVEPNNPPVLQSYYPQWTYKTMILPDSCYFSITATDPDGDLLDYRFFVGDSVLSMSDSAVFHGFWEGEYSIEGRACDGSDYVFRRWFITVSAQPNLPPVIDWWKPEQANVACVVGDTLEFHFSVKDDKPEALMYTFLVDGNVIFSGYPDLVHRFLENGQYILQGTVWDGEYSDTVTWYLNVTGEPDTIPPSAIVDLVGETGVEPRTIRLTWTAPGDDGTFGTAAIYDLRTSTYPILTEYEWENAGIKPDEPRPSPAGSQEVMIVQNLNPGTYLYASVRAKDDFFNQGSLGNCVRVLVRGAGVDGYVIDLWNNEPVAGIYVSSNGVSDTTNAVGYYWLENLPYFRYFNARDEMVENFIGAYYNSSVLINGYYDNLRLNLYVIRHLDLVNIVGQDPYAGEYLNFFKEMTNTDGWAGGPTVDKTWNHYPITVYNPPKTYGTLDAQLAARVAMEEWESETGLDLFVEVYEQIGSDVEIVYVDTLIDKHQVSTPAYNPDGTPAKKVIWIFSGYTGVPIATHSHLIFVHEFGHILCLEHSRNAGHVMLGYTMPLVHNVTEDEANVVRIIYHAPPIYDYATIIKE